MANVGITTIEALKSRTDEVNNSIFNSTDFHRGLALNGLEASEDYSLRPVDKLPDDRAFLNTKIDDFFGAKPRGVRAALAKDGIETLKQLMGVDIDNLDHLHNAGGTAFVKARLKSYGFEQDSDGKFQFADGTKVPGLSPAELEDIEARRQPSKAAVKNLQKISTNAADRAIEHGTGSFVERIDNAAQLIQDVAKGREAEGDTRVAIVLNETSGKLRRISSEFRDSQVNNETLDLEQVKDTVKLAMGVLKDAKAKLPLGTYGEYLRKFVQWTQDDILAVKTRGHSY